MAISAWPQSVGLEQTVQLLEYDPDLGRDLRPERREEASRSATATVVSVPRGPWQGEALELARACPYGVILLDGLIIRTVLLGDDASAQLLGRGDLVRIDEAEPGDALVPTEVHWTVLEPVNVALLDERFLLTVRRWPEVVAALFERTAAQAVRVGTHRALCQLPRVEDRLHALLWFLAERWGRVTPQGVILPLKLTHELLGQLVGAKRPTVSLAIKELEGRGTVHRRGDGAWLLEQRWVRETASAPEVGAHGSVGFLADATQPLATTPWTLSPAQPVMPVPVEQGVAPTPARVRSFAEIRHRIERMHERHERSMSDVRAVLASCAESQRRAALVRDNVARARARAA